MFSVTTIEVIDQQPQRDDEPGDRELAEVEAHQVDRQQAGGERQRDRDHHDHRCAPAQRQQREDDQEQRDRKVAGQFAQPVFDVAALVEYLLQLDVGREDRLLARQLFLQRIAQPDDVEPILLQDGQEDRALAVIAGDVAAVRPVPQSTSATSSIRSTVPLPARIGRRRMVSRSR